MFDVREKPRMVERAFLVHCYFDKSAENEAQSLIDELAELVETLGISISTRQLVKLAAPQPKFLTGSGKAQEIVDAAKNAGADVIVFDNELSPAQQRNWEKLSGLCVIDRQEVILDIFDQRARSKEARLQVRLAQLRYSLPRLTRAWTHLDRQTGGIGTRGTGEKQLESDRRLVRRQIDKTLEELTQVRKNRANQRKERSRVPLPHAAIVGYTNAGKSSLLNALTDAEAFAADQLFATLDTTTRKLSDSEGQDLLLTDTVGFVRNLPHQLVESFKATLEEALLADFLIHLIDASDPHIMASYHTTRKVLEELGSRDQPMITVFNKIDLLEDSSRQRQLQLDFPGALFISVKTGEGLQELREKLQNMLEHRQFKARVRIPHTEGQVLSLAHRQGRVIYEEHDSEGTILEVILPIRLRDRFESFLFPEPTRSADAKSA